MSLLLDLRFAPMRRSPSAAAPLAAARSPLAWAALGAALAGVAGCEPAAEPTFTEPEGYAGLLEEMRTGTRAEVEDFETGARVERDLVGFDDALRVRFGTPSEPAVFTALPVEFSSRQAAVVDAVDDEEAGTTTLTLAPAEGAEAVPPIAVGETLHWSDDYGQPHAAIVAAAEGDQVTAPLIPPEAAPLDVVIGDADLLKAGRELYVVHCLHCHGATGAGDGPTAKYLFPLPRDYRPGVYKFTSTGSGIPRREDLVRVLREGVPGTYMPSFHPALDPEGMAAVVEYVRWLSLRGQYAAQLVTEAGLFFGEEVVEERLANEEGLTRDDLVAELTEGWQQNVTDLLGFVSELVGEPWTYAEEDPPVLPTEPRPELSGEALAASIGRGRDLYLQENTKCVSCHGPRGLGNGPQTVSVQIDALTGQPYAEPGIHDVWGEVVRPRNLTRGIYRGGRRPIDLYRRIHSGIVASNMPGFGDNLTDEQIWDLVNFLLALPHDPDLLEGVEPAPTAGDTAVAVAPAARPAEPRPVPNVQADRS